MSLLVKSFPFAAVFGLAVLVSAPQGQPSAGSVSVRVTDTSNGRPIPCRITVVDSTGAPANITAAKASHLAIRTGVIYTTTGTAAFAAPPGRYTVYATRGLEYGLASAPVEIADRPERLHLRLAREVDTAGYIAADTHIHTLTHSGHGDATLDERMATITGEGIELAVATDHNHHADYRPAMDRTGTRSHFTPVIGNEVTTSVGHFNAFPVAPESAVPDFRSGDWDRLLAGVRAVPGVKVVVLNHPSNIHSGYKPTDRSRFHAHSGESLEGRRWDFDGIEIVTSAALQSDIMKPVRDWFALLNAGHRMAGIGSSDSHEVNAYILGQGRTYVASRSQSPERIDVDDVCDNLKAGRALVSMGLLTEAWVEGRHAVGDTARELPARMAVRVKVQGPRWIQADRLELYLNGRRVLSEPITASGSAVTKLDAVYRIARPPRDAWLAAVATGPGVDKPYWPIPRPYQPLDPNWDPRVIGATNPIRLDADNDGKYSSPAEYARQTVDAGKGELPRVLELLKPFDESVSVQAAALLRRKGVDLRSVGARSAIDRAHPRVRHALVAYISALPLDAK